MKAEHDRIADLLLGINPLYFRAFGPIMDWKQSSAGCSKNQDKALLILNKRGPMLPSQLGTCLNMRRGSLTSLVDSLEEMAFVHRTPDRDDRRRVWVSLTDVGHGYVSERYARLKTALTDFLADLDDGDTARLARGLEDVSAVLQRLVDIREHGTTEQEDGNGQYSTQ